MATGYQACLSLGHTVGPVASGHPTFRNPLEHFKRLLLMHPPHFTYWLQESEKERLLLGCEAVLG